DPPGRHGAGHPARAARPQLPRPARRGPPAARPELARLSRRRGDRHGTGHRARRAARPAAAQTWARRAQHGATSSTPHRGGAVMLAADRGTLDAHTAHYSLAARGGGSCPTDEGIRTFPRTAPGEDIIADRLGGQNRWPLPRDKSARLAGCRRRGPARSGDSVRMLAWTRRRRVMDFRHGSRWVRGMAASAVAPRAPPLLLAGRPRNPAPVRAGPAAARSRPRAHPDSTLRNLLTRFCGEMS